MLTSSAADGLATGLDLALAAVSAPSRVTVAEVWAQLRSVVPVVDQHQKTEVSIENQGLHSHRP